MDNLLPTSQEISLSVLLEKPFLTKELALESVLINSMLETLLSLAVILILANTTILSTIKLLLIPRLVPALRVPQEINTALVEMECPFIKLL
jgi:hypothetical protein